MGLVPLTKQAEIKNAIVSLQRSLKINCEKQVRYVGWQGGGCDCEIFWNPVCKFWTSFETEEHYNRHVIFFSTDDPSKTSSLNISCEINPPKSGINRRCAGVFLKDPQGNLFLAHAGKVGGGRKGIGKSAFVNAHPHENWQTVDWPDGIQTNYLVIGKLGSERLPQQLAHFVSRVDAFKRSSSSPNENIVVPEKEVALRQAFKPEFSGKKKSYTVGTVESSADHGLVVTALAELLRSRNFLCGNDQLRDLYLCSKTGSLKVLFEIKTDLTTTSIYSAIGQLMLHGLSDGITPKQVMVLPGEPTARTRESLMRLGICVLSYVLQGGNVEFENLNQIMT